MQTKVDGAEDHNTQQNIFKMLLKVRIGRSRKVIAGTHCRQAVVHKCTNAKNQASKLVSIILSRIGNWNIGLTTTQKPR